MAASRTRRVWPWLALAAAVPVLLAIWRQGSVWTLTPRHLLWVDMALGPAIACLLIGLASGHPRSLVRLLDSRPIRTLGLCSYSVYLLHEPIVVVVYKRIVAQRYHHGPTAFLVMVAIVVPVTIVLAWLFASVFERPFLGQRGRVPAHELRLPAT